MATLDKAPEPELDTMAEDGAEECSAKAADCEFRGGAYDGQAQECEHSVEDEIEDPFPTELIPYVLSPVDGLPQPIDKPLSPAPAFTRDTFVCVEDDTSHVELFDEELRERGWSIAEEAHPETESGLLDRAAAIFRRAFTETHPHVLWNTPSFSVALPDSPSTTGVSVSVRGRFDEKGGERTRRVFEEVVVLWGEKFGVESTGELVPVRPARERCRYFHRQLLGNDDEPDKEKVGGKIGFRNCERRRSIGGAFLSLANEAVFACDYRDPPDRASVEHWLDSHDRDVLQNEPHKKLVPIFGLEGSDIRVTDPKK